MKAIIRFKKTYRPYSDYLIGVRLQATVPNLAARKMKKTSKGIVATAQEVPSFRKPYLITESMDYPNQNEISKSDVERFVNGLVSLGFTEFEMV